MNLLSISEKIVAEWFNYLRNAQSRILLKIYMKIGEKTKYASRTKYMSIGLLNMEKEDINNIGELVASYCRKRLNKFV